MSGPSGLTGVGEAKTETEGRRRRQGGREAMAGLFDSEDPAVHELTMLALLFGVSPTLLASLLP